MWFRQGLTRRERRLAAEVASLRRRIDTLDQSVRERDAMIRMQQVEIDLLAAVVARDQLRIRAETAALAARLANQGTDL